MNRGFTIDKTKEGGPASQNCDPTELRCMDQTVCECHCKPIDRWKSQSNIVEFEMEKTKFPDPDLYKGKTVNTVAVEGGNKTLLPEPLKVDHEFLKEDSWEDKLERQRRYTTCPLDRSELKQEDMDFENKEDDDDKDGNLQGQDYPGKYSEEESKSSTSGIAGDIGDELQEARAPTIAQLLQEKTLYSFSEWPKDRVIINRIDNICHAVLKGKWPSSQQYEMPSTLPAPVLISSPSSRNSLAEQETPGPNFSNGAALVTQIPKASCFKKNFGQLERTLMGGEERWTTKMVKNLKESFLAPVFAKDERKHRRPYEFDVERDLKSRSLEQFSASHGHPPIVLNGWRGESAIDLSCTPDASPATTSPFPLSTSTPKVGTVSTLQGSLGMDLSGILQAGLIHPVTGQIVNGTLRRDDAAMRRRRGRRKNVEGGMDLVFLKDRTLQTGILEVQEDQEQPSPSSTLPEGPISATSSPHTVTTTSVPAEKTIPNKSLLDWLRQQSDYTIEVPTFGTGFLPENKFSQILTEPVLRDAGPRRRGRRPRSDLMKAPGIVADSPSGMGPLFMNGLIAGMDLVGLQSMRNMQGIPLTGLVGFPAGFAAVPAGEDVKSTLSMLPMMLPGMAAVPQMFGVGGLLNTPMTTTCTSTVPTSLTSTTKSGTSNTDKATDDKQNSHDVKKDTLAEDKPIPSSFSDQSEPAITTSSPVAFNPFLLPGMSPGLIYPSMFLSPGIGMTLPGMQQTRHSENTSLESQKRKRKKAKGDTLNPDPETVPISEKESGNGQNCSEHTPLLPTDKEHGVQAEQSDLKGTHSDTN